MKYHPLGPEVRCFQCGMENSLSYTRNGLHGDVYQCSGCNRTMVHRRQKGNPTCGLVPVLPFGRFGDWKQCRSDEQDSKG